MQPAGFRHAFRIAAFAVLTGLAGSGVPGAEPGRSPPAQAATTGSADATDGDTGETDRAPSGGAAEAADAGKDELPEPPAPAAPEQRITEEGELIRAEEVEEPDLAELPLSNAARVRLDAARASVVLVRGFFGDAASSAFHGTGFVVDAEGFMITNYHEVSEAVLTPRRFSLAFLSSVGIRGWQLVSAYAIRPYR